jgi:hypothetical protein
MKPHSHSAALAAKHNKVHQEEPFKNASKPAHFPHTHLSAIAFASRLADTAGPDDDQRRFEPALSGVAIAPPQRLPSIKSDLTLQQRPPP